MDRFSDRYLSMAGAWAFVLAASVAMAFLAVWWGAVNQDEGWYLYAAQLVGEGKLPYRDFFFTQGPALPIVYSSLTSVWAQGSPLAGLLGGRVLTLCFSFAATCVACALVRRLVPGERRGAAACCVFALLATNLYHLYFTAIPKTYALGSLFVLTGFLFLSRFRAWSVFAAGLSFALASGTRISLVLVLGVVGLYLLVRFRTFRWQFLWLGLGGLFGLAVTYGFFALDLESREGLLAAQQFHAARGGFDPFFAVGSISRLARGYAALGVTLFALALFGRRGVVPFDGFELMRFRARAVLAMMGLSFAAVFLLQLSAPFPYDDYQVPIMGVLTVLIVAPFVVRVPASPTKLAWFVVLVSGMASFVSPLLQEWAVYGQDRFWSRKKECTELAKLRRVGREINALDPGGKTLFTHDLYLAVETGRRVPDGLELGPFAYYENASDEEAKNICVLNRAGMEKLISSAPSPVAAVSGYGLAISAPKMTPVEPAERARLLSLLATRYAPAFTEKDFGQNATELTVYRRIERTEKDK